MALQLDVHQQHILRSYMRRNNMDNPPPQSSPHKHKRIRKRSTSVVNEDKMDRLETSLLAAGVKPEWLKVHRIISKRYVRTYVCGLLWCCTYVHVEWFCVYTCSSGLILLVLASAVDMCTYLCIST